MSVSHLLVLFFATLSPAAQVKFTPDTVCAGNKPNCTRTTTKVVALGTKSIVIRPYFLLSPLSSYAEILIETKAITGYSVWRTTNPTIPTPKGFRMPLLYSSPNRDTIRLKPGDTVALSNFTFGNCFYCASIAARKSSATATNLGNGERVGILFGTDSTHLDTLWVIVNQWLSGGTLDQRPATEQILSSPSREALGRRRTTGSAATIEFTPAGAQLPETP
jgi:hypothetical protein